MTKDVILIGGGSGNYKLLSGLKNFDINLTAIVSMADNGGSTGILRDEFGILPPGDIRQCLVALSNSTELMKQLFQYRFTEGNIKQHSLGNLILTALTRITGSEKEAIKAASRLLNIKGHIAPVTFDNVNLYAELKDSTIINGQNEIARPHRILEIERLFLKPEATATKQALKAISFADLIILGPGDFYGSLLPNLLVKGIPEAIKSSDAVKIFICNLMTKLDGTYNFTALDFIKELEKYLNFLPDYVILNNKKPLKHVLELYKKEQASPVKYSKKELEQLGLKVIEADLLSEADIMRHDSNKVANLIIKTKWEK